MLCDELLGVMLRISVLSSLLHLNNFGGCLNWNSHLVLLRYITAFDLRNNVLGLGLLHAHLKQREGP